MNFQSLQIIPIFIVVYAAILPSQAAPGGHGSEKLQGNGYAFSSYSCISNYYQKLIADCSKVNS